MPEKSGSKTLAQLTLPGGAKLSFNNVTNVGVLVGLLGIGWAARDVFHEIRGYAEQTNEAISKLQGEQEKIVERQGEVLERLGELEGAVSRNVAANRRQDEIADTYTKKVDAIIDCPRLRGCKVN